jgi:SAM-dependent methyltransferase
MQGYNEGFAHIYNMRWTHFAQTVAPQITARYEATPAGKVNRRVLDLACGTGQLARYLLERGYEVVGLDLSPAMLQYARENAQEYVDAGQARFVEGDAADFTPQDVLSHGIGTLDDRFGLVISTFDALNHLPDWDDLESCFVSTYNVLAGGGHFIFDLNTRHGLQRWGGINIQEEEDLVLITRGVVAEFEGRAYTQISGFLRRDDGLYERFGEVAYNTIFDLTDVAEVLAEIGFSSVIFAAPGDFDQPVENPESYGRVFILAEK